MGRIKTTQIKRVAKKLVRDNSDKFKKDFSENKKIVSELIDVYSKKLRNVITGYVTRLVKMKEE